MRRDDEGYHYIVDRKKDMFISGGENVYPAEVELAMAPLDGVAEVVRHRRRRRALGRGRPRRGGAARRRRRSTAGGAAAARSTARLARYKIPKSVVFTDALPRNAGGKVLRQRARMHAERLRLA